MQLTVIGAYLPRLDQARLSRWIAEDVESFKATIRALLERGIGKMSDDEIELRAKDLPHELNDDLQQVALFEEDAGVRASSKQNPS